MYEQAEKEASKRARILMRKMQGAAATQAALRKADILRAIAVTPNINKENP